MSEPRLAARTPLQDVARPGRYGQVGGAAGVTVQERADLALASVIARHGAVADTAAAVRAAFGVDLPTGPRRVAAGDIAFAGIGPGQWLASAGGSARVGFVARLAEVLAGRAAVADQSDGRLVLSLSGPRVLEVLAKGVPVDLHPAVFGPGAVANTQVAYMGVQIARPAPDPVFELMAFRSLAGSIWSWLAAAAAEYGLELRAPRGD